MAVTQLTLADLAASLFSDTAQANAVVAVKSSSAIIYAIEIDNTMNAAQAEFVKIWNVAAGSVTVGTTVPDMIIPIPANVKRTVLIPEGLTLGTAVSIATVTTAGTAGTTSPGSAITVRIAYT